jgi:hypothetical protein
MSFERKFRANIRALADAYMAATGIKTYKGLGLSLFRDTSILRMVENEDATFGVHIYDRIVAVFGERWPKGLKWPKGVERIALADVRTPRRRRASASPAADLGEAA